MRAQNRTEARKPSPRWSTTMRAEMLEKRLLLAIDSTAAMIAPGGDAVTSLVSPGASPQASVPTSGYQPNQIEHAYAFDQITFGGGGAGDGSGQTIAIIDSYHDPNIQGDLAAFDAAFSLAPPPSFVDVASDGTTNYPPTDPTAIPDTWERETALDVEWIHALAPRANILLVEATSGGTSDQLDAIAYARSQPNVSVVSMSFSGAENILEQLVDYPPGGHAGVTYVASTGDSGAPGGYPAYSPNVLAVGGTTLHLNASNNISTETGWAGSGGGISQYEAQPPYQSGVVTQSTTKRTIPDVSFDADPGTGVDIYDSYDYPSQPWITIGGTSFGAPAWSALIAIADQGRGLAGLAPLDGPFNTLPTLYSLPSSDFHDIKSGNNGFPAGTGYDLVTGLGTPIANRIVGGLDGSSISGNVFFDANDNGVLDNGDSGMAGVTVYDDLNNNGVFDPPTQSSVSDAAVPQAIPDASHGTSTMTASMAVSGLGTTISDVNVSLDVTNASDANLLITLISPSGVEVPLVFQNVSGADLTGMTLDDQAASALSDGTAPYSGSFRPSLPLSNLNGLNPNGVWQLEIINTVGGTAGTVNSWSLQITAGPDAVTTTAATGAYHFANAALVTHRIHEVVPAGDTRTAPASGVYNVTLSTISSIANDNFGNVTFYAAPAAAMLFYHDSPRYDTTGNPRTPLPFSDDNAIASDKTAYVPGAGAATFASISSYAQGINGIMVDLTAPHGTISANDFIFKVGNNNSPNTWTSAPAPATVLVRPGAGMGGTDRVELIWTDDAIQKTWLEVIVKGDDALGGLDTNTRLTSSYAFFFGSSPGDDGNVPDDAIAFRTDANDEIDTRNNPKLLINNIPITNIYDYNRDGKVDANDQIESRDNPTSNVGAAAIITIGAGGPLAPSASPDTVSDGAPSLAAGGSGEDDGLLAGVATALTQGVSVSASTSPAGAPGWPSVRGPAAVLESATVDAYFQNAQFVDSLVVAAETAELESLPALPAGVDDPLSGGLWN